MALKHGEANPLSIFGLRRVDHCPPHFSPVIFPIRADEKVISDWIWENLDGRFFCGVYVTENGKSVESQFCAAFEIPGEASYFTLMLDSFNKNVIDL